MTAERITSAALAFIDRHGVEELTVRRLADELGTGHASLYRHIESRDALLVEVFDAVLGEIRLPPKELSWRKHTEMVAHELRRVLLAHPSLLPLARAARLFGPNALAVSERTVSVSLDQGLPPDLAAQAFFATVSYVVGVTMVDFQADVDGESPGELRDSIVQASEGQHPSLEHVMLNAPRRSTQADINFEFGLGALLDRIERMVS